MENIVWREDCADRCAQHDRQQCPNFSMFYINLYFLIGEWVTAGMMQCVVPQVNAKNSERLATHVGGENPFVKSEPKKLFYDRYLITAGGERDTNIPQSI